MQGLTQSANIFVNAVKIKLSPKGKGGYPAEIANNISIGSPVQEGEGRYSITISFSAIMAAAFELGSGLHDIRGATLYPIRAKNVPQLRFFWAERGKWFRGTALPFGHPGIEPRPFIKPTVEATKPEIIKILGDKFKASIILGIKEVWSNP